MKSPTLTVRNPYAENRPATPETFYGRAADVRWMLEHLAKPYPDSLAIAGPRRIGKTSLLHYVSHIFRHPETIDEKVTPHPDAYRALLAPGRQHLHVYIDASRVLHADENAMMPRFWRALLRALYRACHERAYTIAMPDIEDTSDPDILIEILEDVLHALAGEDVRVIFYLDEVEKERFSFEVGQILRALAMQWGIAVVIASQRSLLEWLDDPQDHNSPFYNMLAYRYLRPMPADEAYMLLTDPARRRLSPHWLEDQEALLADIVDATGGHPALVKLAGERLWELSQVQQRPSITLEEVLNHVRLQGEPIFKSIWNALNAQERQLVQAIVLGSAETQTSEPETERLYDTLRRDGILVETEEGWRLFSPLFTDYVRTVLLLNEQPATFTIEGMQVYLPHKAEPIPLTRTEHRLLAYLLAHRGQTCTRAELLAHVWNKHEENKVLDVTIQRLRRKIEPNPAEPQYLLTVRGQGYRLDI